MDLSALHWASLRGHVEVVEVLLAHPDINVNLMNMTGQTPLSLGCECGRVGAVQVLLKDPRVDITLTDNWGCSPLCYASSGYHEVVEYLIANGRDLGDVKNTKGRSSDDQDYTCLEIARRYVETEVVSVLERFLSNPTQTRHEVRVKLGVVDALAADLYAVAVFLCDATSSTQASSSSYPLCRSPILYFPTAHGAADDLVPSCGWVNEAEYSSQRLRGCLQISCRDSSFSLEVSSFFFSSFILITLVIFAGNWRQWALSKKTNKKTTLSFLLLFPLACQWEHLEWRLHCSVVVGCSVVDPSKWCSE